MELFIGADGCAGSTLPWLLNFCRVTGTKAKAAFEHLLIETRRTKHWQPWSPRGADLPYATRTLS